MRRCSVGGAWPCGSRTGQRKIAGAEDSGEAAGSGAAQQAEEDGFGLIVAGVRGGHAVEAMIGGSALEKIVAGAASGGFERKTMQRGQRGDIAGFDDGVEGELRGERSDELRLGVGFSSAEMVVEVQDEQDDAEFGGEFGQRPQQGHRIRTAADGDADAFAGPDQTMAAQVLFQRLEHRT